MSDAVKITMGFEVSEGEATLKYFDFIAQALESSLRANGVDRLLLCQLVGKLSESKQWQNQGLLGLQSAQKAKP